MIRKVNEIKAQRFGKKNDTKKLKKRLKPFQLDRFDLMDTLGTGTFGRVRLAKYRDTDSFYALKIMKKSNIVELKQDDHIKCEVQILSNIAHPFIVGMEGYFQTETHFFIALEYVQGGELYTRLMIEERLSMEHARFYAMEVVLCFEYLHQLDVVYRDLKPENILITREGHLKITDFGFAKTLEDDELTWTLCGTPEYLAPEIIQSQGHGKSVDWWTLGILIHEMIAGYPPFHDENPFVVYQKILTQEIEFHSMLFERRAKNLIKKLLARDLTKRLGCTKGKSSAVKAHKWFSDIDWDDVLHCRLPVPYIPTITSSCDTSHFEEYPDSDSEGEVPTISSEQQTIFRNIGLS